MTANDGSAANEELQFDRVVSEAPAGEAKARPLAACVACKKPIEGEYFHVNGKVTCASCRGAIEAAVSTPKGLGLLGRSAGLGVLAAIAGAAVYYAVIAITNFEIGIVAILIGYMVGWAVRKGAAGRGGRRFQILAVALTYWAVGLAYAPIVYKGMSEHEKKARVAAVDSTRPPAADFAATANSDTLAKPTTASRGDASGQSAIVSLAMLFFLIFALPVLTIAGSMPSGLLSAFIIFIGLRQAWAMTGAPELKVSGPYRVNTGSSVTAA
jgi:hypothetical protein